MFELTEDAVGALEVDDAERIGIGHLLTVRPFGDQDRRSPFAVGMTHVAEIDVEVFDQLGEHAFGSRHHGRGVHTHQLGGDLGHQ